MNRTDEIDDPRRLLLIRALTAGLLGVTAAGSQAITFGIFGSKPRKLPPGQSIYGLSGQVMVNGQQVNEPGPDRGFMFQRPTLLPWMTVFDNVAFPCRYGHGLGRQRAGAELEQAVMHYLDSVGLRDARDVQVAYPGIDPGQIRAADQWQPYFLLAGRIMWTKNIEMGIAAFAQARAKIGPEWRLVIAGMVDAKSEAYMTALRAFAAEVGGVEFRVAPSDDEMRALYEGCTAVVFTAFNEDWGLVPLEAMAAGKPVIAVNRGGPCETVLHGQTGYLEEDSPEAFARRMTELAANQPLARQLGLAGTERVRQFTWDAFVEGLDRMVDQLAEPTTPAP